MVGTEGRAVLFDGDDTRLGEAILLQVVRRSDHAEDLQLPQIAEEGEDSRAISLSLEATGQTPTAIGLTHHRGYFSAHGETHLVHLIEVKASEGLAFLL